MFSQPFVENLIKHGIAELKHGKITITIDIHNESKLVKCIIEDNGKGYITQNDTIKYKSKSYESISTKILSERIKKYSKSFKVNAKFEIKDKGESKNEPGTIVQLRIPFLLE